MTGERAYPIFPCPDLDEALEFYRDLGFSVVYVQKRPYPAAAVARGDLQIHLSGIAGFDPAASYASAIITVDDPDAWHDAFTSGLKAARGRVPTAGIPRVLRVRRKAGTATGFSVVDVGGNWLRFYRTGASEDEDQDRTGLARVIDVAARQGDARGDDAQALKVLDAGLARHPDAPADVRAEALSYRAELLERLGLETSRR
jgi:catechol 2,3-dioxygenase-like lactoylglutathione lyase family enzyme